MSVSAYISTIFYNTYINLNGSLLNIQIYIMFIDPTNNCIVIPPYREHCKMATHDYCLSLNLHLPLTHASCGNPANMFTLLQYCHNMTVLLCQRCKVTLQQQKCVDSQIGCDNCVWTAWSISYK